MFEDQNWVKNKNQRIIGADEVVRGSLAGPIVGAAVKLEFQHLDLLSDVKDSKNYLRKREEIYERVKENKSNILFQNVQIYILTKMEYPSQTKKCCLIHQ